MIREPANKSQCAIGRPVQGVTVKLSDGDSGELLVKKDVMFTRYAVASLRKIHPLLTTARYIGDDDNASASFTDDGFYKTGDLVHRSGDDYVLEGRTSTDCMCKRRLHKKHDSC